ncbi:MAG: LPS export ABC transporter periplasmic protein LptC [Chroococcales cyanobacterium]
MPVFKGKKPSFRAKWIVGSCLSFLLLSLASCQQSANVKVEEQPSSSDSPINQGLVLDNATLEQADEEGKILWKLNAEKTVYSKDKKSAQLENLIGNLFEDGEIVMQLSAKRGEIQEDGEVILLRENITANDVRNGAILQAEELDWLTTENILIARNNLVGKHSKLEASANEGKYYSQEQRLELMGKVLATAKEPLLQLKTEKLLWQIPQEKVISDRPLEIDQFQEQTVTDRLKAGKGEMNIQTKIITLQNNIELKSLDPAIQVASHFATWNVDKRILQTDKPIKMIDRQEQLSLTGNQGQVNLETEVATLTGGVEGINFRNQGKLYSNQLTWQIPTQLLQAQGNVIYQQANPPLTLTGPTAVGRLQENNLVVTGNNQGQRVVTEIIPN